LRMEFSYNKSILRSFFFTLLARFIDFSFIHSFMAFQTQAKIVIVIIFKIV